MIRWVLEASGTLEPRRSALEDDFEEEEEDKEEEQPMEIDEPNGHEKVHTLFNSICSQSAKF
jgi:pre-mRNA-splicing factor 38A